MTRKYLLALLTCLLLAAAVCLPQAHASSQVRMAQQKLDSLGFDPGPIDGKWGPRTRAALKDFQRTRDLEVTERLNAGTKEALGLSVNNRSIEVAGVETSSSDTVDLYDQSYALLVGVSDYNRGWPGLSQATSDVDNVHETLENQGFQVGKLLGPEEEEMKNIFEEGKHRIKVVKNWDKAWNCNVRVRPGEAKQISAALVPREETSPKGTGTDGSGPSPAKVDFIKREFNSFPGSGTTVQPARASWTTGFFLEAIYSRALEHLGYEVKKYKESQAPVFYRSLAKGDLDFWANGWFPLHNEQLPANFQDKASLVGYVVKKGAVQGYLVSKEQAEKYHITTLEDFKRPEVKEAFDANGDGKADLVACPKGWGCERTISHHMYTYDLESHINLIKYEYSEVMADAVVRYNMGNPVFFYTWTPNWTINKLKPGKDVVWIGVPEIRPTEGQEPFIEYMTVTGLEGAVTDPLALGWVPNDIRVAANDQFLDNNPAAKKLFKVMSIPFEDITAQNEKMHEGEDDQEEIEGHTTEWIRKNKDTWIYWQRMAREAAQ